MTNSDRNAVAEAVARAWEESRAERMQASAEIEENSNRKDR